MYWAEVYEYSTGGMLGTTVASPIFDHSGAIPRIIGVVAVDAFFKQMEALAGGGPDARTIAFEALRSRIKSTCPTNFKVGDCALQALRHRGGSNTAMCTGGCSKFESVTSGDACMTTSELPQTIWKHQVSQVVR